jgi:Reverse transcriptase (RNA-dependent DNA polymerase)
MRRAEETELPPDPTESTTDGTSALVSGDFSKVTHGEPNVDPICDSRLLGLPSDLPDDKVTEGMLSMLDAARVAGLPMAANRRLQDLVFEFADIWRIGLSPGPPAKIPAMRIQLKPDAQPVRVRVRKYPVEQREFLSRFVGELVANGHAFRNPHATWCAAPLLVPKEGAGNFRFTFDLRPVNRVTVPNSWPMPHLESELGRVSGSRYFSTFDLSNGYWQLALHEDSRDCQSFITPDGVFTPTRVLHGASNAVAHMQSSLQGILHSMSESVLSWLDDLFLHASSVDELLAHLRKFFTICRDHNIKLHPLKCSLFSVEAKWCGRIISAAGVRFDPRRLQGFRDMSPPRHGRGSPTICLCPQLDALGASKFFAHGWSAARLT